jgi:hypothetical protein
MLKSSEAAVSNYAKHVHNSGNAEDKSWGKHCESSVV